MEKYLNNNNLVSDNYSLEIKATNKICINERNPGINKKIDFENLKLFDEFVEFINEAQDTINIITTERKQMINDFKSILSKCKDVNSVIDETEKMFNVNLQLARY